MSEVNGPETPRRPRAAPAGPLSVALPLLWPPGHVHCRPRQAAFDPVDVSSVRDRSIGSFSQEQSYKLVSFVSNSQAAGKNLHFVLHGNTVLIHKNPLTLPEGVSLVARGPPPSVPASLLGTLTQPSRLHRRETHAPPPQGGPPPDTAAPLRGCCRSGPVFLPGFTSCHSSNNCPWVRCRGCDRGANREAATTVPCGDPTTFRRFCAPCRHVRL